MLKDNARIALLGNPQSTWIKQFYKFLKQEGFTVKVFCFDSLKINSLDDYENDLIIIQKTKKILFSTLIDLVKLYMQVRRFKPKIIWSHYVTNYGFYGSLIPYNAIKCVSTWGSDINNKCGIKSFIKRMLVLNVSRLIIPSWSDIDFVSKVSKYIIFRKDKILKVFWGVDTNEFFPFDEKKKSMVKQEYGINKDKFIITSIRHAKKIYNIDTIIDAFIELDKEYNNMFYIFITGFSEKEVLQRLKYECKGKNNYLILEGFVDKKTLNNIYNITNLGVSNLENDMVGAPIMELIATGGIPLLSPLRTYKNFFSNNKFTIYFSQSTLKNDLKKTIVKAYNEITKAKVTNNIHNIEEIRNYDFIKQAKIISDKFSDLING